MKSIKQLAEKNDLKNVITAFIKLIGLAKLSKKVNFKRKSVVSLTAVVSWLLATKFARHSLYRAQAAKEFTIRTARNVLNDGRINWQRLLCLAAKQLIARLKPVIDRRRRLALIVDDTLMSRSCSQKTELLAKVYDHNLQKFLTGYRGLTLGWSDANTFLPVNFALMSTGKPHNLVGHPAVSNDQRSVAGKRRCQAQRPMNIITLELIDQALANGVPAQYVLFDSWFSSPKMFWQLKQRKPDGVGMLKQSIKIYYRYRGRAYGVKDLYQRLAASNRKRKEHYLYSCVVEAHYQDHRFPLKLVFVTKRGNKSRYLVLATTQIQLQPAEIIQLYGRRWQIETYFKAAKQYLALNKSQIQDYDGLCGYIAVTGLTYDLLAWLERQNKDDRTIGDLFYLMNTALPDIKFLDALVYLIAVLQKVKKDINKQVAQTLANFLSYLPAGIRKVLRRQV